MSYIEEYQKDIAQITSKAEIEKLVGDLIILNSGILITDVRERWQHGQSVKGGIIGTYRWADYKLYKQSINPLAGGNVDLMLTGALSGGLAVRKKGKEYQLFSVDEKYEKLGRKYGFEEFGVTEQELSQFFDELYDFAFQSLMSKLWQ